MATLSSILAKVPRGEETLRRQVAQLDGQVTHLARDYRTLAETLHGRWT